MQLKLAQQIVAAAALAGLGIAPAASGNGRDSVFAVTTVRLSPPVVVLRRHATISVTGFEVRSLEVLLEGATQQLGKPLPWTPLHFSAGGWRGVLPAPEFRGEYPVELRIGHGTRVLRSNRWLLRVFARGTLERPVYRSPEAVARWWVSRLPGPATLEAMKRWPRPRFDKRDPRLHQLLVVAYSLPGRRAVRDRLGMFVTAVRDEHGWRLLEASVTP
jgi:hypothetical protein